MTARTKRYIAAVSVVGLPVAAMAVLALHVEDLHKFLTYLTLAMLASAFKVRLPKIPGTYSLGFLLVLLGIAGLSLAETIFLGCCSAIVQSYWRPKTRPSAIQMGFNLSVIAISISVCYGVAQFAVPSMRPLMLAWASAVYYTVNTGLVAGVISRLESRPFLEVWQHWLMWTVPYYLVGAAIAALMQAYDPVSGWQVSLLALPITLLVFLCYRQTVGWMGRRIPVD